VKLCEPLHRATRWSGVICPARGAVKPCDPRRGVVIRAGNATPFVRLLRRRRGAKLPATHRRSKPPQHPTEVPVKTVLLLVVSNTFMTLAWYGHLKFKEKPLWLVIFASWGIALFEYVFQVPANRIGSASFSVTQLKVMQECITLVVFSIIAALMFGATLKWNMLVAYALIVGAVYFAFLPE
jgi:uncharacterized protein (DUF486 family)